MAFNGAGSLFALGIRLAKLDSTGAIIPGTRQGYVSKSLIALSGLGLEYEDGEEVLVKNGSGDICLYYRASDTVKQGTISGLQVCTPDPLLLEFLAGFGVFETAGVQVGGAAPETGVDPTPNGVSLEFWTHQIVNGAKAGYWHWAVPRAKLKLAETLDASGTDPMLPSFEGTSNQNPNWGDGPGNDWFYPSNRVWQYRQTATVPDLSLGYITVPAELTVTSLAILPATASIDVSDGTTQQLNAVATMSDLSTRDVTEVTSWVSSDPTKATVNSHGLVSPVAAGSSTVTGTYLTANDTVAVTVTA